MSDEQAARVDVCYKLDTNAVPPEYVLIDGEHANEISALQRDLQLLATAVGRKVGDIHPTFACSVVEAECEKATEGELPDEELARIVWLRRRSTKPDEGMSQLAATDRPCERTEAKGEQLEDEKYFGRDGHFQRRLEALTSTAEVHEFEAGPGFDDTDAFSLAELCCVAASLLGRQVERIAWKADSYESEVRTVLGLEPADTAEMQHHLAWWRERAHASHGRTVALQNVLSQLLHEGSHGRILAIVGPSGSGKTALCAMAAQHFSKANGDAGGITMVRFLGTSARSRRSEDVVRSLGEQWLAAHAGDGDLTAEISMQVRSRSSGDNEDYATFKGSKKRQTALSSLLEQMGNHSDAQHLLVLDGLDQLEDFDESRSKLRWLLHALGAIPENVRILVSCLSDEGAADSYGCETQLTKMGVPKVCIAGLDADDVDAMIDGTLRNAKRTLTSQQRDAMKGALGKTPNALFCKPMLDEALRWHSWEPAAVFSLAASLHEAMGAIFDRLELIHGTTLVRHALSYITASRRGLSSEEMLDVLSLDDEVLQELFVFENRLPSALRLPAGVWLALREDIGGLLVGGDGPLFWCHRQWHDMAAERYECPVERREKVLAAYWSGEWCGDRPKPFQLWPHAHDAAACTTTDTRRMVAPQPLLLAGTLLANQANDGCLVNARRGEELAFQLLRCGKAAEAGLELVQGLTYAEMRLRAGQGLDYVRELAEAAESGDADVEACLRLVRSHANVLGRRPERLRWLALEAPIKSSLHQEAWKQRACGIPSTDWAHARISCATLPKRLTAGAWLQTFEGHEEWVKSVALSADGKRVVSGSYDHTVRVWDAHTGECLRTLEGHTGWVMAVALSGDGKVVASGSTDKTARVWDTRTGQCLHKLGKHGSRLSAVAISGDGTIVVTGCHDHSVCVWDVPSKRCVRTLAGHCGPVLSVALTEDGSRVVSGSDDNTIRVFDVQSGKCERILLGHGSGIASVAMSADGACIFSGSYDKTVRVWDASSGRCLQTLEGHRSGVESVASCADGARVVSGSYDHTVCVWNTWSGECVQRLEGHTGPLRSVAIDGAGERVVSGSADKTVRAWDVRSNGGAMALEGHQDWVMSVALSFNGKRILSGSEDRTIRMWDARSGECIWTFAGHLGEVKSVAISLDDKLIVSGSEDRTVRVWDAHSRKCLLSLEGHADWVKAVAIDGSGTCIVSGSGDRTVRVWDAQSGDCVRTLEGHRGPVRSVAIDGSGKRIVSGSEDRTARVWDAQTGECLQTLGWHGGSVKAVAVNAEGTILLSGSEDGAVRVWDTESGECVQTLRGHGGEVKSVAFSADGTRIVSGSADRTIRVWDAQSGDCVRTLEGHRDLVKSVALSTDGTRIVSGSEDRTVRVWDAHSGEGTKPSQAYNAGVRAAVLTAEVI